MARTLTAPTTSLTCTTLSTPRASTMPLHALHLIQSACHKSLLRLSGTRPSSIACGPPAVLTPSYGASRVVLLAMVPTQIVCPSRANISEVLANFLDLFGWKGDSLQRAMDKSECFYDGCGSIKKQAMATANQCTVKDMVGEATEGCMFYESLASAPLN